MSLLEYLRERFRPELPVRQDILEREKRFNESDSLRESWVLDHVYLCKGDLEALKQHPDFNAASQGIDDQGIDYIVAHYETPKGKKGPCRRVVVNVPLSSDEQATIDLVEKKLKLDLYSRGSNSGIFYKRYKKDNSLYAEAVPATLSSE